ncbi:MAG: hypothetical protein ABFS19_06290 [Thermodesulfobacteriota bacterium]
MAVGLKEKINELVNEENLEKRREVGNEILFLCEEIRKLVTESHDLQAKIIRLEEGFFD